nr:hypothetical protein BaRGS_024462 [Batillaria attramentaria]
MEGLWHSHCAILIFDPNSERYEVPMNLPPKWKTAFGDTQYTVTFADSPFGIGIYRKFTSEPLFDSRGMAPLIFADQFLQIGTKLTTSYLYGFGEHRGPFLQDVHWRKLIFWTRDQYPMDPCISSTQPPGTYPPYDLGLKMGVFLKNKDGTPLIGKRYSHPVERRVKVELSLSLMGYTILSVLFVKVSAVQHRSSHFQKKCFHSLIPGEGEKI